MKSFFLTISVIFALASPAFANNINKNSPNSAQAFGMDQPAAASSASSVSRATAGASAAANLHNSVKTTATGGTSSVSVTNMGGGGTGSGGDSSIPRTVPPAYAPTLAPAMQCGGVTSSGGIGTGFASLSFGRGEMDRMCQITQYMRDPLAFFYACRAWDNDFRKAALEAYQQHLIARPCPQDAKAEPEAQPVLVAQTPAGEHVTHELPDYCFTASAGERKQHYECHKH